MAAEGELPPDPVDDGEWVLFWTLVIVVLYFALILALAIAGAVVF